jgi:phosphoglycerate dehydrogenase-like enzyme
MGLVGYGSIGRECARLARALGMRVLAARRSSPSAQPDRERFVPERVAQRSAGDDRVELLDLERVLAESDYLVVSAPLTAASHGLIGRRELALMKPTAFLINVGRGAVVDEASLADALGSHRLAGAALDVFATEPPPDESPLFGLPNVLLSPHVSGNFAGYFDAVVEVLCTNLERYLDGRTLLNIANRSQGY